MLIFLHELILFFCFIPFDVPSSSVSILVEGLVTSSLTRAFFVLVFLIGITLGSFTFSLPLASKWIALIALSFISLGNGGIAAAACGGCLKICGWAISGGCG